jgi:hypothetical protein
VAMQTLLERKDDKGLLRVFYLSGEEAHGEPAGIYADIAYYDGTGYSQHCGSYVEAAHHVFRAYGFTPSYARRRVVGSDSAQWQD